MCTVQFVVSRLDDSFKMSKVPRSLDIHHLQKLLFLLLAVIFLNSASSWADEPVTYQDVKSLLKFKVPEAVILEKIQGSPTAFTLDEAQVAELKGLGASEKLLNLLQSVKQEFSETANIAILLDCSGSMGDETTDGIPKMQAAKHAVKTLLQTLPTSKQITFVIYGHDESLKCQAVKVVHPLGPLDDATRSSLMQMIDQLEPAGQTPIANALEAAGEELARGEGLCGIVLISDGKENCHGDPTAVAARLNRDLKMPMGVNVVGLDLKPDEKMHVWKISQAGRGSYLEAGSAEELITRMAEIERIINRPPIVPAGISLQENSRLSLSSWMTSRPLTNYGATNSVTINGAKISANGEKIIYACEQGTFVIPTDQEAARAVQVGTESNGSHGTAAKIDITPDGNKVVWSDKSGWYVANTDGSQRVKMPGGYQVDDVRITADGSQVFVFSRYGGGIYRLPSDASDQRVVVSLETVGELHGVVNKNLWGRHYDISSDGRIIVFSYGYELYRVNQDGSNLRKLTNYLETDYKYDGVYQLVISDNGATIAYLEKDPQGKTNLVVLDASGEMLSKYADVKNANWLNISADGTRISTSAGLQFFESNGGVWTNPFEYQNNYFTPLFRARQVTMSGDFSKACVLADLPVVDKVVPQVVLAEFFPDSLEGLPTITNIQLSPPFLLTDGANTAELTATVSGADVEYVAVVVMRDGRYDLSYTYYGANRLYDDGSKSGDLTANDETYTTNALRLYKANGVQVEPGGLTLRLHVHDKHGRMTSIDLEGLEAR